MVPCQPRPEGVDHQGEHDEERSGYSANAAGPPESKAAGNHPLPS
jgi:hypothetical protein